MGDPEFRADRRSGVRSQFPQSALGLILNKPLPMRMGEIFEQLEIELGNGPLWERQVLRGGPMQTDRGFVVHRAFGEWDSTLKVSDALHVTTSRDILGRHGPRPGTRRGRRCLGVCGLGQRSVGGRDPGERMAERAGGSGTDFRAAV